MSRAATVVSLALTTLALAGAPRSSVASGTSTVSNGPAAADQTPNVASGTSTVSGVLGPDDSTSNVIIISDENASADDLEGLTSRRLGASPAIFPRARVATRLEARFALDTHFDRQEELVAELGLGGRLELDVDIANGVSAYVQPSFHWLGGLDRTGNDRETLLVTTPEARVSLVLGAFDLRLGTLIFNWGSSDLIGPNDVLNPIDYRRSLITSFDDAKIPVLAVEATAHLGAFALRAVVEPFFSPSRFFLTGWDTSLIQSQLTRGLDPRGFDRFLGKATVDDLGDRMLLTRRPSDRPDNATVAARASFDVRDLNVAVSAVHGFETLPELRINPDLAVLGNALAEAVANKAPFNLDGKLFEALDRLDRALERGESVFYGRYNRRDVFGFDLTFAVDPFIIKLDTAYTLKRTLYTQQYRSIRLPWLNSVLGVEYLHGSDIQILVEAFVMTIPGIPSDARLAFFEPTSPPPSTTFEGRRTIAVPGVASAIRYSVLDDEWVFELGGFVGLTRGDFVFLPAIRYRLSDEHRVSLSGLFIQGHPDGYGGVFGHNDQISISYQWTH